MPELFKAEDAIGTVHYSRFTVLSEKTLLFLGDFDGEFGQLMAELAKQAGPVFDAIFQHVDNPPPLRSPIIPTHSSMDGSSSSPSGDPLHRLPRRDRQGNQGIGLGRRRQGAGELHPFLVILPIKSGLAFMEVQLLLRARAHETQKDLATVGTPHFAQFVPLEDNQIGFFTVYDGSFDKYIADFTKYIGPVFDLIFKFTKDPPPSPCRKYFQEFIDFAAGANRTPIGFYQAYPGLSVQDIHALIADSKSAVSCVA